MENVYQATLYHFVDAAMRIAVIIVFFLAAYWNLKYVLYKKWEPYHFLKYYTAGVGIAFVIAYTYLLIADTLGYRVDVIFFRDVVIRPLIFLTACAAAGNARAKVTGLDTSKGMVWKTRNSKN